MANSIFCATANSRRGEKSTRVTKPRKVGHEWGGRWANGALRAASATGTRGLIGGIVLTVVVAGAFPGQALGAFLLAGGASAQRAGPPSCFSSTQHNNIHKDETRGLAHERSKIPADVPCGPPEV